MASKRSCVPVTDAGAGFRVLGDGVVELVGDGLAAGAVGVAFLADPGARPAAGKVTDRQEPVPVGAHIRGGGVMLAETLV